MQQDSKSPTTTHDDETPVLGHHREHLPLIYQDLLVDVPVHYAGPLDALVLQAPNTPNRTVRSTPDTQV